MFLLPGRLVLSCTPKHVTLFVLPLSCLGLFFYFLFLPVSVWGCVVVEAWRAVSGCQWGYLWFIYGHSSKKPVDAASLSHPLCPSHCFSIGLPSVPGTLASTAQLCPRCHPGHDPLVGTRTDCQPGSVSLSTFWPTQLSSSLIQSFVFSPLVSSTKMFPSNLWHHILSCAHIVFNLP